MRNFTAADNGKVFELSGNDMGTGNQFDSGCNNIVFIFNNYSRTNRMNNGNTNSCDITIFLPDGTTNTLSHGTNVWDGQTLTIEGGVLGTGTLMAQGRAFEAGIGGGSVVGGNFNITGGTINATGGNFGAGIGGGNIASGGTISITGNAKVYAKGGDGDTTHNTSANITIGNGTDNPVVVAYGGTGNEGQGAGLGDGSQSTGASTVTVNSGFVVARSGTTAAADIGNGNTGNNRKDATVIINGGSVYAYNDRINALAANKYPTNGAAYGSQPLSVAPALVTDFDGNGLGGANVSAVVNQGGSPQAEYIYNAYTVSGDTLSADFVTAVNVAMDGTNFIDDVTGEAWLWLPAIPTSLTAAKSPYLPKTEAYPETLVLGVKTTVTPHTYARERDSHITLTITGKSALGPSDAARTATLKYFRESVNNPAAALVDGETTNSAYISAFDSAAAVTFNKDGVKSNDTYSILNGTIAADQNARYWVLATYTSGGETVYDITHYDVKNIFTTVPVWMSGFDEGTDISTREDEFENEFLVPVNGNIALKTAIPFDLATTMPHKDNFDTKGKYNWGTSALEVVDLSSLSAGYTNAHLAYDEIELYPEAYKKNLYAWKYSYDAGGSKIWGEGQSPLFPTVTLDGDFINTAVNKYEDSNDPQFYVAWLEKGDIYKKIWAQFVDASGTVLEDSAQNPLGMDILVPINEGYTGAEFSVSANDHEADYTGTWDSGRFRGVGGAISPPLVLTDNPDIVPRGWYVADTPTMVDLAHTSTDQTGLSGYVRRDDFYGIDPQLRVENASPGGSGYYELTDNKVFYIVYAAPSHIKVITNQKSTDPGENLGYQPVP